MSFTVYFAIFILAFDFLLYFLFRWVYGEKHVTRRKRTPRPAHSHQDSALPNSPSATPRAISLPRHPLHSRTGSV